MRLALERRAARKQAHDKLEMRKQRLSRRKDELERERRALELKREAWREHRNRNFDFLKQTARLRPLLHPF